jgi:transcription termination factor Rho
MVLAELRQLAGELKIPDTTGMRKGDLIAAIKERQSSGTAGSGSAQLPLPENDPAENDPAEKAPVAKAPAVKAPATAVTGPDALAAPEVTTPAQRRRRAASRPAGAPDPQPVASGPAASAPVADAAPGTDSAPVAAAAPTADVAATNGAAGSGAAPAEAAPEPAPENTGRRSRQRRGRGEQNGAAQNGAAQNGAAQNGAAQNGAGAPAEPAPGAVAATADTSAEISTDTDTDRPQRGESRRNGGEARTDGPRTERGSGRNGGETRQDGARTTGDTRNQDSRGPRDNRPDDDGDEEGGGRRGRRFRDRRRGRDRGERQSGGAGQGSQRNVDTEVRDGDVLLPVAGIIDVLDNYAFVRTTGYLSGPTDVYVSLSVVRRYGLRRGDAITGAVREPREGEQSRQKFNPLVRVDAINGQDPEALKNRPEFTKLTPLYPNERLRLETEPSKLTTRVIDLVMPIGKGQRALIVSPPKAGKTMIMQSIANAITTNNPECHLMVVLVDERPEEVTDMQRSVKGEVIASTFDRPPGDHTTVAELAIERAKRLVEMGHDVVVLLDSITRLGRAYNLAAPASGRILSGGVDSTALYPPKRFLGAARNIEDGGSLTIFATALVETGSTMDTVIFEEFKGTGNAELKLDRKIADKRVFPAIDIDASGTRKEELLLSPDELAVTVKLRRVLAALDDQQALDLVLGRLKKTRTNIEFLMQVAKNSPGATGATED